MSGPDEAVVVMSTGVRRVFVEASLSGAAAILNLVGCFPTLTAKSMQAATRDGSLGGASERRLLECRTAGVIEEDQLKGRKGQLIECSWRHGAALVCVLADRSARVPRGEGLGEQVVQSSPLRK